MNQVKKGKMPISQKQESSSIQETRRRSALDLSPDIASELDGQGLVGRWLNAKRMADEHGFHQSGWKVYRRPENLRKSTASIMEGNDPEGFVRYRDLILGVKTKEDQAAHRRSIANENARLSNQKALNQKSAEELRYAARQGGVDAKVTEGYDESSGYKEVEE
jgi:hypothetical protein